MFRAGRSERAGELQASRGHRQVQVNRLEKVLGKGGGRSWRKHGGDLLLHSYPGDGGGWGGGSQERQLGPISGMY